MNRRLEEIVTTADSCEAYLMDGSMAGNYSQPGRDLPTGGHVELLGDSLGGFYTVERLGLLEKKQRKAIEKLLLDLDSYSMEATLCIFTPTYGLRYYGDAGSAILFITNDCALIEAVDEWGERLDGGNIMPSSWRWKRVLDEL